MVEQTERDDLRLMGVTEAAAVLGVREAQVREWFRDGTLPSVPVGASREPRINRVMLEAWCTRRATEPATRGGRR